MLLFRRTSITWLCYGMIAFFAYGQSALGAAMPFLRVELGMSYTLAGLHFTGFALGVTFGGMLADMLTALAGRRLAFWLGGIGMALATGLLLVGATWALTIAAAFGMGMIGTIANATLQTTLADQHGIQRSTALAEAMVAASSAAGLAPLMLGQTEGLGAGWRLALVPPVVLLVIGLMLFGRIQFPARRAVDRAVGTGLPPAFWRLWLVLVLSVAVEFGIAFWGTDFFVGTAALTPGQAATVMTAFFLAMLTSRVAGTRLTRRFGSGSLLCWSLGVALIGFTLFWLAPLPLAVAGLVLIGLGAANLYPLAFSLAIATAPGKVDAAAARLTTGVGLAMIGVPLLLGGLADVIGMRNGYGIILIAILAAWGLVLSANVTAQVDDVLPQGAS